MNEILAQCYLYFTFTLKSTFDKCVPTYGCYYFCNLYLSDFLYENILVLDFNTILFIINIYYYYHFSYLNYFERKKLFVLVPRRFNNLILRRKK